jgi:hypothetical protein
LADKEANAYTREVEAVQPCLHVQAYVFGILTALPLENALGDGGDGGVVAALDVLEDLCEPLVVVPDLGRPLNAVGIRVVSLFTTTMRDGNIEETGQTFVPWGRAT